MAKRGLGKGLDALFEDNDLDLNDGREGISFVRLSDVEPNEHQPRRDFDDEKLEELCMSIKEHGILSPLIVKQRGERYMIVAGERRWRAARRAGLKQVPVIIKELDEKQVREIALIENLQRQDLNAIEEAAGYHSLMEEFSLTQEQIAQRVSKSRAAVANMLRLLTLPVQIIDMVKAGDISAGHARALLSFADVQIAIQIAERIVKEGLSVRDVERLAQQKAVRIQEPDLHRLYYKELENDISHQLGRKVKIITGKNKGKIELEYYGAEDLEQLYHLLTGENKS